MGKISDCDVEGMWIEECKNCHGSGYICTRIADSLNDKALLADVRVGDWVEMDYKGTLYHRQVISVHDNGIRVEFVGATPLLSFDGKNNMVSMRLVRKLSPSEVIIHIGCLSGTVRKSLYDDGQELSDEFLLYQDRVNYAIIPFTMLDAPTRKLVESLLKAQEEG
jgi:hypothetical protein